MSVFVISVAAPINPNPIPQGVFMIEPSIPETTAWLVFWMMFIFQASVCLTLWHFERKK